MIQVLDRAVCILEYVAKKNKPVSLPEISEAVMLSSSTCANILFSLTENGLLEKHGQKRQYKYTIGYKIYELSQNTLSQDSIRLAASSAMNMFANKNRVSCILATIEHQNRKILHEAKPSTRIQVVHHTIIPAYASSMGRFLLAYYSPERLDSFITHFGMPQEEEWMLFADSENLKSALQHYKAKAGIPTVVEKDEVVMVFNPLCYQNKIVAAIGIYLPLSSYQKDVFEDILHNFNDLCEYVEKYF